jgi:polar amino acid transport system substrate-binding protein
MRLLPLLLLLLVSSCATVPPEAARELAPTGTLRAAINVGNPVLAQRGPAGGDPQGVSVDLARELARRLDVPISFVVFDAAGKVFDAMQSNAWDVAFLAIEPVRSAQIDFTLPYVIIEGTYLVPVSSPLRAIEDVDREGIRIAVGRASAYDLFLTRTLKHAQLVRAPTSPDALAHFAANRLDAAAGVKQQLVMYAKTDPNVRLMDGRFMLIQQAMGMPKGRERGAQYLRGFVEEMKASGFVAEALRRTGQTDASVAP